VPISVENVTLPVTIGVMNALLQMSTVLLKDNTNLSGLRPIKKEMLLGRQRMKEELSTIRIWRTRDSNQ
jgi:hypothetical protein